MGCKTSLRAALGSFILAGLTGMVLVSSVTQAGETEQKISMQRVKPDEPIGRDAVLAQVKARYKGGRILSIQEKPLPGFPDCHIVRMLSQEGEYLTIKVACSA